MTRFFVIIVLVVLFLSCNRNDDSPITKLEGEKAGGETTVFVKTSQAFGLPASNLSAQNLEKHLEGMLLLKRFLWPVRRSEMAG